MKNPKKKGDNTWDPKDIDANSTDTKEEGSKQEIGKILFSSFTERFSFFSFFRT